jgi:hypothetical protein
VQHLGDRRGQRGLAVVDVTDGADVDVRLGPLELRLSHCGLLLVDVYFLTPCPVEPQVIPGPYSEGRCLGRLLLAADLLDDLVGDVLGTSA